MSKLIRTTGTFPPGGYSFRDTITGKVYEDSHTTFEERVQQIIAGRSANSRLFTDQKYISHDYVADELSRQICARINNHPEYCTDGANPPASSPSNLVAPAGRICTSCGGSDLEVLLCKTCGGSKIEGLRCKTCGARLSV